MVIYIIWLQFFFAIYIDRLPNNLSLTSKSEKPAFDNIFKKFLPDGNTFDDLCK